ncbi:MAG: hypothetical protein ABI611_14615, partial [Solirubrobacteraceae bacterium]
MKPSRNHIAAAVTVLALGVLATVALATGGTPQPAAAPVSSRVAPAPEVRTEIVRETIHRRAKRKRSHGSRRAGAAPAATRAIPAS